jgi:hypothetical protein
MSRDFSGGPAGAQRFGHDSDQKPTRRERPNILILKGHSSIAFNLGGEKSMFQSIEGLLGRISAELRHHADPANHAPIHIEPARSLAEKALLLAMAGVGLLMIPVAAAVPMLPIWPFALLLIACLARVSSSFRARLMRNRAFNSVISLIRARPEKLFQLASRLIHWSLGARRAA